MIYQLGVLFLFGTCMSLTSALPPCVCTRNLKPVCGSDGQTYSNECLLECQRTKTPDLTLVRAGTCESERAACICTLEYAPVCGTDGVSYPNRCSFNCDAGEAKIAYPGECRSKREAPEIKALPPCVCTREAKPVCGTDGHTYSNPCMLNCAKEIKEDLHIDHVGHCETEERAIDPEQPQCTCARNLQPVCASNGVTYGNECLMRCAGADLTVDKDEPCEAE